MTEKWHRIPGLGDKYEISNLGRVKTLSFMQRYTHWRTGKELFRKTKERILAQQKINSGYMLVHLWHEDKRIALTVHRLVAKAFCPGFFEAADVNHLDFDKTNNSAANLEWVSRQENLQYSARHGRRLNAIPVTDSESSIRYPSLAQAARDLKVCAKTIKKLLCPR